MYLEENKELADGMNHLEIRLGDHGYVQVDRTWHSEQVCSPFSRLYLVRRGEAARRREQPDDAAGLRVLDPRRPVLRLPV